jgi:phosphate/sulfate permease
MDQIYIIIIIAVALLAVVDLIVGVSNDAVNFLNSAIGSKAVSFKTIMIVASLGIAMGALFSSGMMEIARSGIFIPSMFSFKDVMIIFAAVMITDVLLLDVFNSIGLPTSTTVSIIFEILGAAVCLGLYKIYETDGSFDTISNYINTQKASEIVYSILLSVILSFTIGSLVQYLSRLIFTFQYEKKLKYFGALFGGVALTSIFYFLFIKGIGGTPIAGKLVETVYEGSTNGILPWINEFYGQNYESIEAFMKSKKGFVKIIENGEQSSISLTFKGFLDYHYLMIIALGFVLFTGVSYLLQNIFKQNILRVIIIVGTFSLALAFAGNDLVNFIGVPIAAWQGYNFFMESGATNSDTYMMGELASNEIQAPFYFLAFAGLIMVITLWTSSKAKAVIETGVNLSRQGDGVEKFSPNSLSRFVVRMFVYIGQGINYFLPKSLQLKIDKKFEKVEIKGQKKSDEPAFDMIRASVNLMVASILISIGTSLKLPLSTTYVTFMVAMGSSFADRAWDRESAVYRVAGVFNVIGGWFVTAFVAFTAAFIMAYIMKIGWFVSFVGLLILVAILLFKNSRRYNKKAKAEADLLKLKREDIVTINEIINESSHQIAKVVASTSEVYSDVIQNLGLQDLTKLKENKKTLKKLEKEVDELKSNVYYFIKNLDETSVEASKFYVMILGYLQDMVQSLSFITQNSHAHINNNHKQLKFNQIRDLKNVDSYLTDLFMSLRQAFEEQNFEKIDQALNKKNEILAQIEDLIQKQIARIRTTETSPKNSKLYFGLLLETNDLVKSTMSLLELFKEFDIHVKNRIK